MIDLHLHLDGSLSPALAARLAREQGVDLPAAPGGLERLLEAPSDCQSLEQYLRCFRLPLGLLQSGEALTLASRDLACRLADQGLLYGEVRFAPQLHTERGLTQGQAVEAAWAGLQMAMKEKAGFSAQLILCCMRGGGEEENRETLETARHFLGQGVCAVDLAGAEALYPASGYRELFARARAAGVPFTLHAGEADGPESIWEALALGAARIGHGVRAREDPALVEELARRQIPLELCPTSNLQTKAVPDLETYPLREYLRQGLAVTLNTDNMTVSHTTLGEEYQKLRLSREEGRQLLENSVGAAFLPAPRREALLRQVLENMGRWLPREKEDGKGSDGS